MLLLSEIGPNAEGITARRAPRCSYGQSANLLRCRNVTVQKRWREITHRHIVKAMTRLVLRKQRGSVDFQHQEISDCILVLNSIEPPQRIRSARIRMLGRCAVERRGQA